MVRKAKGESEATYCALLDAAEQTFADKGVSHTTLNDVACAAGLTRGAIYWHFKDKSALLEAMCDRVFLPMQTLHNEITATAGNDPLAALRQMMMHMLEQVSRNERQRKVFDIMFHHCEKDDDMAFFTNEKSKRSECMSKIQLLVGEVVTQGKLPAATDTALVVQAINGYLIGLLYEWLIDTNPYDLGKHAGAMIDLFLAGLVIKPPLQVVSAN